jgi:nicotinate-nucleotide--dimethylbenzimidazole phosphoribosyltransferase
MNSDAVAERVRQRLDSLTKPPGSLGRLEELALQFALAREDAMPVCERKGMYVFCANHGVTEEGVSPYPSSVTVQMVDNFERGGAAINVLCRLFAIETVIIDAGVDPGTDNFARRPAMTRERAEAAVQLGRSTAEDAATRFDVAGLGEMGIGNTTTAAALLSVFSGADPDDTVGAGTGADSRGIARKAEVVRRALDLHRPDPADGLGVLAAVGGFEIAAMAGFLVRAADLRLPVVVDGFPCGAAALAARALKPGCLRHVFFAHRSAERGHDLMLRTLGATPLLDLGMRLGEGTGAALAIALIESAVRLYREMATFADLKSPGT